MNSQVQQKLSGRVPHAQNRDDDSEQLSKRLNIYRNAVDNWLLTFMLGNQCFEQWNAGSVIFDMTLQNSDRIASEEAKASTVVVPTMKEEPVEPIEEKSTTTTPIISSIDPTLVTEDVTHASVIENTVTTTLPQNSGADNSGSGKHKHAILVFRKRGVHKSPPNILQKKTRKKLQLKHVLGLTRKKNEASPS